MFWEPYSTPTVLIAQCTRTPFGHVSVGAFGLIYDGALRRPTGWYPEEAMTVEPSAVLTVGEPVSITLLNNILPGGVRYPLCSTLLSWATGYPRYPLSCVGATKRALLLAGVYTTGRTPYGIYKSLLHVSGHDEGSGGLPPE